MRWCVRNGDFRTQQSKTLPWMSAAQACVRKNLHTQLLQENTRLSTLDVPSCLPVRRSQESSAAAAGVE